LRIFVFNILRGFCSQNIENTWLKSQGIENKGVEGENWGLTASGSRFSVRCSPKKQREATGDFLFGTAEAVL
jgi:hypothetical protein